MLTFAAILNVAQMLNGDVELFGELVLGESFTDARFRAIAPPASRSFQWLQSAVVCIVEPGKTANLLLLRANPLQNVEAYDTIETVFIHGRPIPRAELSARHASSGERQGREMSATRRSGLP